MSFFTQQAGSLRLVVRAKIFIQEISLQALGWTMNLQLNFAKGG